MVPASAGLQISTLGSHGKDFRTSILRMTLMSLLEVSLLHSPSTPPS
ncbi:rCG27572, partial [Rattus norvegicus]